MPIDSSCATAAARVRPRLLLAAALCAAALLGACATVPGPGTVAQAERPPKDAQSLDDAVTSLTVALFARSGLDPAEQRVLVVDPLIDRATGNQAAVTRTMEPRMMRVASERFPNLRPSPFAAPALDQQPIVLVGSITAVAAPGVIPPSTSGPAKVYRIWASLADTRTGRIISKEMAWVRAEDVDMTPTAFFRDSPAWVADRSMTVYLKTCAGNPGDAVDPAYLNGIKAAAAANDGIKAYEGGRYLEALANYTQASLLPGGDQMRVWNGVYLTNVALGRRQAAEEAFGRMVEAGLGQGKLAVKFVFRPGSTGFWPDRAVSGQYPLWLRQIAYRSAARNACLRLVGHTSPTGTPAVNEALSERRAQFVRAQLVQRAPVLRTRTEARGRGSSEPLVGSGRDDATDVLDRRVEFEPYACDTLRAGMGASGRV